ncbi:hypothetical protein CDL12_17393 [Handroanthus impetiginosus]|uniref:Uncharacterized protein n=1 Tax=Handroanthus impetiginosus TaxID=429701 RepID=A0A2G9GXL8_9LAMI|nr:hypothetical protein CDL12_17393 [Handroanthus impetiginosus]
MCGQAHQATTVGAHSGYDTLSSVVPISVHQNLYLFIFIYLERSIFKYLYRYEYHENHGFCLNKLITLEVVSLFKYSVILTTCVHVRSRFQVVFMFWSSIINDFQRYCH